MKFTKCADQMPTDETKLYLVKPKEWTPNIRKYVVCNLLFSPLTKECNFYEKGNIFPRALLDAWIEITEE